MCTSFSSPSDDVDLSLLPSDLSFLLLSFPPSLSFSLFLSLSFSLAFSFSFSLSFLLSLSFFLSFSSPIFSLSFSHHFFLRVSFLLILVLNWTCFSVSFAHSFGVPSVYESKREKRRIRGRKLRYLRLKSTLTSCDARPRFMVDSRGCRRHRGNKNVRSRSTAHQRTRISRIPPRQRYA